MGKPGARYKPPAGRIASQPALGAAARLLRAAAPNLQVRAVYSADNPDQVWALCAAVSAVASSPRGSRAVKATLAGALHAEEAPVPAIRWSAGRHTAGLSVPNSVTFGLYDAQSM